VKIDIQHIPAEKVVLQETTSSTILDLKKEGVSLTSPLRIQAEVSKGLSSIDIKVNVRGAISFSCSRCLEKFEKDINREMQFNFPADTQEHEIDLTDQIRQEVILSDVPLKPVCGENCKGLCAKCGENLNKGQCKC